MAMFSVVRHKIIYSNDDKHLFMIFWSSFKENYVRSSLGGVIFLVLWTVLLVDYYFFVNHISEYFVYLFLCIGFFLLVMTIQFFSVSVHLQSKLIQAVKNAGIVTIANPILSLAIGLITIVIVYTSFSITTFLIPFFVGAFLSYLSFFGFYHFFNRIIVGTDLQKKVN